MSNPGSSRVIKHPRVCVVMAVLTAVVALIAGSHLVPKRQINLPSAVILASNFTIPPQKTRIPDRWIPRSRGWMWRLKEAVLGKAKAVSMNIASGELDSVVLGIQAESDADFRELLSHPACSSTNGLKVWLLPNSKIRELRNRFSLSAGGHDFFRCGIETADGVQARLQSATLLKSEPRSFCVDALPVFHGSMLELAFIVNSVTPARRAPTEPAGPTSRTNVPIALRLQLPAGTGFFVLDQLRKSSDGVETAVLVTVEPPNSKVSGLRPAAIIKRGN